MKTREDTKFYQQREISTNQQYVQNGKLFMSNDNATIRS